MNRLSTYGIWLAALPLLLAGCGANEATLVGHWKGKVAMTKEQQAQPFSNLGDAFAASMSLDVKADHTFHMVAFIVPIDGTWALSGRRATFTPKAVFGYQNTANQSTMSTTSGPKTDTKPFVVEVSSDGKSLTPVGNGADQDPRGDFTFTKEE